MLDVIYIGTAVLFFAAFALYALGCEKALTKSFMETSFSESFPSRSAFISSWP